MMIRSNGQYFDFDGDIEIEDRIKLFEDPKNSNGAFSYDIEMPETDHNRKILGLPSPDAIKSIYQNVPAELIDDTGQLVYTGKLQLTTIENKIMFCVFYSGNTEWFGLLSSPLSSLPLYRYDVDLTEANIMSSWSENSGIVFPIIDSGALITRSYPVFKIEDFVPFFYVKTIFSEIFNPLGIKLQGDLLEDPMYNSIGVFSNTRSQDQVDARSTYARAGNQSGAALASFVITFNDDTTSPFYDGSSNNWDGSKYTADVKMLMEFGININLSILSGGIIIRARKNGVNVSSWVAQNPSFSKTFSVTLEAGDYFEWFAESTASSFDITDGTFKAKPTFIYKVFGVSSVPNWTQGDFISNILRIFNALPSYNPITKTLTIDLFNKIKDKQSIDISELLTIDTIDYSEFVSGFGKNNIFSYQEGSDEDLRKYKISNFIRYGSGNLTVNNDFIDNTSDVIESDFTSPITYVNVIFDASLERIDFVELEEISEHEITSVTTGTRARFNITDADVYFTVGDLIRLDTDALDTYNGDWVVDDVTTTYITVRGLYYSTDAVGRAIILRHNFTNSDEVYLMANIANVSVSDFSSNIIINILASVRSYVLESTFFSTTSLAYFNMLSNNRPINKKMKQSLSFGTVNNPLSYQRTILDTYWPVFSDILSDPVMLKTTAHIDKPTYDQVKTFLRPVRIRTNETNNLYYINRITGYKDSSRPCYPELIKL